MSIEEFLNSIDPWAGWHLKEINSNRILIRDSEEKCPILHVANSKGYCYLSLEELGEKLGLTHEQTEDIIFASDRIDYLPIQELRKRIMDTCFPEIPIYN